MQYFRDIELDTFVTFGIKGTDWVICNWGLLNLKTGKILKRVYNSGSFGYFIDRKFKSESKLPKYPLTKILHFQQHLPF
jgi:hypothetical protein